MLPPHTTGRFIATGETHLPRRNSTTARLHRDWLKKLPDAAGKTLTRIAKEIKISPSTLTRPLKEGDDGTSTLHANTIAKVVEHTGVAPPFEIAGPQTPGRRSGGPDEEATPYNPHKDDPVASVVGTLRGTRPGLAPWLLHTRALELAGFLPGDVVLVDLGNVTPRPGEAVCAHVYDWGSMKAETVMRIFERASGVNLLVAKTTDPTVRQPHVVDGEQVTIKGVLLPHRLHPAGV